MNGVDQANQLINHYKFGAGVRNTKWWWSLFFWALGTACVNAYLLYRQYMISHGSVPLSHYEFRKSIALCWLEWRTHWSKRYEKQKNKEKRTRPRPALSIITRQATAASSSQASNISAITCDSSPKRCKTSHNFGDPSSLAYQHRLVFLSEYNHLQEPAKKQLI